MEIVAKETEKMNNVNIDVLYTREVLKEMPKDYLLKMYAEVALLLEKTRSYEKIVKYSPYKVQIEEAILSRMN